MNEILANSNLKMAISKIDTLKNRLALPDTLRGKSIHLYKKILEKNIPKGRSIDVMVAATIYVSCRDSEIPCILNDVTKATGLTKSSIARCYRTILVTLNLQMSVSNIEQCVFRIAKKMEISEKIKHHAISILNYAGRRNHLAGKDPMGMAAAAIYLASMDYGGKISQRKLAKVAMLTEVTIRSRCKGLQHIH